MNRRVPPAAPRGTNVAQGSRVAGVGLALPASVSGTETRGRQAVPLLACPPVAGARRRGRACPARGRTPSAPTSPGASRPYIVGGRDIVLGCLGPGMGRFETPEERANKAQAVVRQAHEISPIGTFVPPAFCIPGQSHRPSFRVCGFSVCVWDSEWRPHLCCYVCQRRATTSG